MKSRAKIRDLANRERPIADYLPLGSHVAPDVVMLRGTRDYMATWRLPGISFETIAIEDLNERKEGLTRLLHAMGGGQYAVWSHTIRRPVVDSLDAEFDTTFARELDRRYKETFADYRMMRTEHYFTVIYRPAPTRLGGMLRRVTSRSLADITTQQREDLDAVAGIARQVESSLSAYSPERLTAVERQGRAVSEMATFLGYLANGFWEDIPYRPAQLAEYLPTSRLHFGDANGMLQIEHPTGRRFVGFLDVKEYAPWAETGMFDAILYVDFPIIQTQSFAILNKRAALARLRQQRNQLVSGGQGAESEIRAMDEARDQVQSGTIAMGEYHYSLAVFGDSLEEVTRRLADARSKFESSGMLMTVVDVVPEAAWFAQTPGNFGVRPREAILTSYNFACLAAMHGFYAGKRDGNPWGQAITLLQTPNREPCYFNFHTGQKGKDDTENKLPGNTCIVGSTGVGKTTLLSTLIAQATSRNPRIAVFDQDRGTEICLRALGGQYTAFRRGVSTGINPFQWPDTPLNRSFCKRLVQQLVRVGPGDLPATEQQQISDAVNTVYTLSRDIRCLSAVEQNLQNVGENSLRMRLQKWCGHGDLAWLLDNRRDTLRLDANRRFGFDYGDFGDDSTLTNAITMVLLYAVEGLIDGSPCMIVGDEFARLLDNPTAAAFATDQLRTIRKQYGLCVFATQSPADVLAHPLSRAIIEQCVTHIALPNPRATWPQYKEFGYTPREFEVIRSLPEASRLFLYKQGHQAVIARLDLSGMDEQLIVLSGSTDNVLLLDDIRAEVGDEPDVWLPILTRRVAQRKLVAQQRQLTREAA